MLVAPSRYIPGSVCRHELRQKKNENGTEHILVQPLEICTANMRHTQKIEKKPTKFRAADTRQFHKSILIYYLQAQWLWCFCCSMVLRFVARLAFLRQMSAIRSNFLTDRRRSAQTITTTNNKKKKTRKKMMMSDERNIIICLNGSSREWRISWCRVAHLGQRQNICMYRPIGPTMGDNFRWLKYACNFHIISKKKRRKITRNNQQARTRSKYHDNVEGDNHIFFCFITKNLANCMSFTHK